MVPSNALQRTFRIQHGSGCGTSFTVDQGTKQYLVTARHVVAGIKKIDQIEIFFENKWHSLDCEVVGEAAGNIDITVLSVPLQLSPTYSLQATTDGVYFGQDVYFLGFPYNLFADIGAANRNFPLPFIKRATLSSMIDPKGEDILFLDGHNNPGFSGGPVIYSPPGTRDFRVAGVISGYRYENEPIFEGDTPTPLAYRYNTGIIIAYNIRHAVDLIRANPIGYQLS